jgi:hypothetical protein
MAAHGLGVTACERGATTAQGERAEQGGGEKRGGESFLLLAAKEGIRSRGMWER